jgi:KUP system potassium uptake protein
MAQTLQTAEFPVQGAGKRPTALVLGALGVVYGDIDTSTLYGLKQAVEAGGAPKRSSGAWRRLIPTVK